MPTSVLFQRIVDDELALAPALVGRVLAGTFQLLAPSRDSPLSLSERPHQADIVGSLQRGAAAYERLFVESLGRQVAEELDESREPSFGEPKSAFHPFRFGTTPYLEKIRDRQKKTMTGPVFLQDHGNPVKFRDVWVLPTDDHAFVYEPDRK